MAVVKCVRCGKVFPDSFPRGKSSEGYFCWDCAFIVGLIESSEYLKYNGFGGIGSAKAAVHGGKIYVVIGKNAKFHWEKNKKELRNSQENVKWRTKVFERDNFTCVICGQVGGELNAHHIKPFAKYPKDRFKVENGVTLCKKCHKEVHKAKDEKWIHN